MLISLIYTISHQEPFIYFICTWNRHISDLVKLYDNEVQDSEVRKKRFHESQSSDSSPKQILRNVVKRGIHNSHVRR